MTPTDALIERIGLRLPIIQAPMAGISSPAIAAAASNTGALGSLDVGASSVVAARKMIDEVRAASSGPFNVNLFVHRSDRPA